MVTLVLSSFPSHLTNIIFFYQLHCEETTSNQSGIKSFSTVHDSVTWFRGQLTKQELLDLPPSTNSLTIQCSITILKLESGVNVLYSRPLPLDLKEKSQFVLDWKVTGDQLQKLKTLKHGKFISQHLIHDEMWLLQCAPDGYQSGKQGDYGSVRLFMQLCAVPNGIDSMQISRKLECLEVERQSHSKGKDGRQWGYAARQNSGWGKDTLKREDIKHLDAVTFRATINVTSYTTTDGDKVVIDSNDRTSSGTVSGKKRKRSDRERSMSVETVSTDLSLTTPGAPVSASECGPNGGPNGAPNGGVNGDDEKCKETPNGGVRKETPNGGDHKETAKGTIDDLNGTKPVESTQGDKDEDGSPPRKKRKTGSGSTGKEEASDSNSDNDNDGDSKMNKNDGKDENEENGEDEKVSNGRAIVVDQETRGAFEWKLSDDLLRQFANAKYREQWQSASFVVGDLKWCLEAYPAGYAVRDKAAESSPESSASCIVFLTMMTELPSDTAEMWVCWTLYNEPTKVSFTSISKFTAKNNSFGFCEGILSLKELSTLKNSYESKVVIGCKLTVLNTIKTADFEQKLYRNIFPLKVRDGDDGISGEDVDSFCRECTFRWKIEGETLKLMKTAYTGKCFESEGFNGNLWNLRCAPNGEREEDSGKVALWLQLNAFPMGIGKMYVEFELECVETKTKAFIQHNYYVMKSAAGWKTTLLKSDIENLDSLTFSAKVEIRKFYNHKKKLIKDLNE